MSVELGVATEKHARGLIVAGKRAHPMINERDDDAVLLVHKDGTLEITSTDSADLSAPGIDATMLPAILRGGVIAPHADLPLSRKVSVDHAALGIASDGRVVVARGAVDSADPLARALKSAGCTAAVLLDRGEQATGLIRRAGKAAPPVARSRTSVLFVLGESMKPRSFHFSAK